MDMTETHCCNQARLAFVFFSNGYGRNLAKKLPPTQRSSLLEVADRPGSIFCSMYADGRWLRTRRQLHVQLVDWERMGGFLT